MPRPLVTTEAGGPTAGKGDRLPLAHLSVKELNITKGRGKSQLNPYWSVVSVPSCFKTLIYLSLSFSFWKLGIKEII